MADARKALMREVYRRLRKVYGTPQWEPSVSATDELVLTILSQHTNDRNRDRAFEQLKQRLPTWEAVARAPIAKIEEAIRPAGLSRMKSARIREILERLHTERGDYSLEFLRDMKLPEARAYLLKLGGVGPKTAACVLLFAFGKPVFPVDTHIHRVTRRLGLIGERTNAEAAHEELGALVPPREVYPLHILIIRHGRDTCHAQRPECPRCPLLDICPTGRANVASSRAQT